MSERKQRKSMNPSGRIKYIKSMRNFNGLDNKHVDMDNSLDNSYREPISSPV